MSRLDCATCPVRDSAACAALSSDERERLARLGEHRTFRRGETIFAAGDDNMSSATLISGALKISSFDRDGNEHILALVHPSGFVGEMFTPIAHHDVIALTDSRLCIFSRANYEAAISEFPALASALLRRSAGDLYAQRTYANLSTLKRAESRVAGFLTEIARAASHSPCHSALFFDLPVSRSDIANLLGLTIETVSRQLGRLEANCLISRQGKRGIEIRDLPGLEALV